MLLSENDYPIQVSIWVDKREELSDMELSLKKGGYDTKIKIIDNTKYPYALFRNLSEREREEIKEGKIILEGDTLRYNKYNEVKAKTKAPENCVCICCGIDFIGYKRKKSFCHNCSQKAKKDSSNGEGVEWKLHNKNNKGSKKVAAK